MKMNPQMRIILVSRDLYIQKHGRIVASRHTRSPYGDGEIQGEVQKKHLVPSQEAQRDQFLHNTRNNPYENQIRWKD